MHQNQVLFNVAALAVLAFPLSGCGGGGGSKSSAPAPAVITTTPPPANITQTLQLNGGSSSGLSVSTNYIFDYPTDTVVFFDTPTAASPTTVNVTPSGTITSVTLNSPNASRFGNTSTWTAPGDNIVTTTNEVLACEGNCTTVRKLSLFTTNGAQNYQYMSYGDWIDQSGTSGSVNGVVGYTVVGQPTSPANIPSTGSATYLGTVNGLFNDSGALTGKITASFSAVANFSARTLDISTSGTQIDDSVTKFAATEHNTTGTLSYVAGSNQFSGPVSTATSGMTGTATGQFFGPTAQEIGGVFDIAGGSKRAIGTFAGKQ